MKPSKDGKFRCAHGGEAHANEHDAYECCRYTPEQCRQRRNLFVRAERALRHIQVIQPSLVVRLHDIATAMDVLSNSEHGGMSDAFPQAVEDAANACEGLNSALKEAESCGLLPSEWVPT